jgi:hypothetical protein
MEALTVERTWITPYNQTTILKDSNNKVKAIFSSSLRQPKRGQKEIIINCFRYSLNWDNVPKKYIKAKDRI